MGVKKFKLSVSYSRKTGLVTCILFKNGRKLTHFFRIPLSMLKQRFLVVESGSKRVFFRKFLLVACVLERCIKNGVLF